MNKGDPSCNAARALRTKGSEAIDCWMWYVLRFLFSSLLSYPCHSPLDSQGLLHTSPSLSHPCPCPLPYPHTLLSTPAPSLLILPLTPLNTELLRSMDLPWISPGSPLRLTDTRLRVSPCFPSLASLVSPSSPHPCFSVTSYHLISLLSLIPCTTIDFFSH